MMLNSRNKQKLNLFYSLSFDELHFSQSLLFWGIISLAPHSSVSIKYSTGRWFMKLEHKKLKKMKFPNIRQHESYKEISVWLLMLSLRTTLTQVTAEVRKSRFSSVTNCVIFLIFHQSVPLRSYTKVRMLDTVLLAKLPFFQKFNFTSSQDEDIL